MRLRAWLSTVVLLLLFACQREQQPASPPSPSPRALPPAIAASPAVGTSPAPRVPSPGISPQAADDDDEDDDIDKPWGPEFEIDGDASWYFGWAPMVINFTVHPLNGSPPFTYTWDFADGSPPETGEMVVHRYETPGAYSASVTGKDGNGETYRTEFFIRVVTPEEYAERKRVDLKALPTSTPIGSTPVPGSTPLALPTR